MFRKIRTKKEVSPIVTTMGLVVIGGVFVEAALIPGILLGCSAFIAPKVLRAILRSKKSKIQEFHDPVISNTKPVRSPLFAEHIIMPTRSIAKMCTFRATSTGLDFAWNYAILGDVGVAAGLSSVSLVVAPLFYLIHETVWNIYSVQYSGSRRIIHDKSQFGGSLLSTNQFRITTSSDNSKILKTITYRLFATVSEFGTNYVFARNLPQALSLTAFSATMGPFIYYGHEIIWEKLDTMAGRAGKKAAVKSK